MQRLIYDHRNSSDSTSAQLVILLVILGVEDQRDPGTGIVVE